VPTNCEPLSGRNDVAKTFEEMWNTFYADKESARRDWQVYEAVQQQEIAAMVVAALREAIELVRHWPDNMLSELVDQITMLITPAQQTALDRHDAELREEALEEAIATANGNPFFEVEAIRALKESRT
jgi:hypothetical protein